ncbi:nucleotide-binding protein [Candidatus Woesearchaeota archaeon]|nr:nucleotide-binding protein [Candidatus Woesearchaeota archaeon]
MLKGVKKIILDTNFLLIPGQFGVDIFAELQRLCDFSYEPVVLNETIEELSGIMADKKAAARDRSAAKLGIQLIKAKGIGVLGQQRKVFKSADKAILELASASGGNAVVATQDRELRDKLASKGAAVIVLRQKRYLKFYQ